MNGEGREDENVIGCEGDPVTSERTLFPCGEQA